MTQKRTLLKYGILSLALAAPLSACAFDSLTVIGDSLSDTGNNGRWTWDSGQNKLYDEQLAERYGLELSPSSNGGSNYAAGGATATPELNPQDNTADQVRQWLAKTGGKPTTTVCIFTGSAETIWRRPSRDLPWHSK